MKDDGTMKKCAKLAYDFRRIPSDEKVAYTDDHGTEWAGMVIAQPWHVEELGLGFSPCTP
jgi:hypothetical protein